MVIYLDGSGHNQVTIALVDTEGNIRRRVYRQGDWHQSDKIIGLIDQLLRRVGQTMADITGVIVVRGPGGFTAVRLSVAIANALGYVGRFPVVGVVRRLTDSDAHLIARGRWLLSRQRRTRLVLPEYSGRPHITLPR